MFCPGCGAENPAAAGFCNRCGGRLTAEPSATGPVFPAAAYLGPQKNSGKAVASVVLGAFAILLNILLIPGILAVIFGHLALSEIKKSAGRLKGEGMAIAGLVMGYLSFLVIPVILIIAAIAIPNLLRSRIVGNESSAVSAIRTINTAEVTYALMYPTVGFTCSLTYLDGAGQPGSERSAGLIDSSLASGQKSGYRIALSSCSGTPVEAYQVVAEPVAVGQTGVRAFCSDQTGVIRFADDGSGATCLSSGSRLR